MKKFFLIFFCCFLAMTTLTGCMAEKSSTGRVLTDGAGREVRIPEKPSRIVSLTYGTDEILLGLVSTRRISALSKYAGDEGITFVTKKEKEAVGRTLDLNPEAVMALNPDLVLVSTETPANFVQTLSASGVPVFVSIIPKDWDEMETRVQGIANAVDEEGKGKEMIEHMREKRDALEKKLSVIPPDQERTALGITFRGILGKRGTLFSDILKMAHVKDGAAIYDAHEIPRGSSTFIFMEVLPAINPDVILMPVWQSGLRITESEFAQEILSNPAFQDVKAVKNKRLVPFPERYKFVMSQHITDAVEASAKAVYPELFDDTDIMTPKGN